MRVPILRPIGENPATDFTFEALQGIVAASPEDDKIELYFSSPGGDVVTAHLMYSYLTELRAQGYTISSVIASEASSAASYLMQVANKGMRRGFPHSMGVIHKCALPPLGRFTSDEAARLALDLAKTDDSMASIYADASGKDAAFWLDVMAQEKRFSAAEMLEIGLIDEILTSTRAQALATEIETETENLTSINIMDIKKHLQRISAFAAKIAGKKAMELELEDGTKLFIYTEDGEIEGKQAVIMGEDGLPTEDNAPVGTHTLLDGRSIVVGEGGIISAVEESELAKAHATIASLQGQLTEASAAITASVAAINAAEVRIDALSRKQSTTQASAARTAASSAAAPSADALDAIGILARTKNISREQAQFFYSKQFKNK